MMLRRKMRVVASVGLMCMEEETVTQLKQIQSK